MGAIIFSFAGITVGAEFFNYAGLKRSRPGYGLSAPDYRQMPLPPYAVRSKVTASALSFHVVKENI